MVKSPPELWAELSEVENLERHLGEFGEIKITRAEPETTVAWKGENASGIVELEPTGWGTKVTITAEVAEAAEPASEAVEPVDEPVSVKPEPILPEAQPEPVAELDPGQSDPGPLPPEPDSFHDAEPVIEPKRRGLFARFRLRKRRETPPPPPAYGASEPPEEPAAQLEPEPPPQPEPVAEAAPSPDYDDHFEFDFALGRGDDQPEVEEPPCEPIAPERAKEVLETALENLGQAHHRPFSRD